MSETYVVRTSVFSSGERFPVLLFKDTLQPVPLPARYVIDMRRETKQSGTIEQDVRVLGWLYEWAKHVGIDLESSLRRGELIPFRDLIGFCRYLRAYRNHNVIGSISYKDKSRTNVLSPKTFNTYINVVQDFLIWAAKKFIPRNEDPIRVREAVRHAKESIEQTFRGQQIGGRSAAVKGLTDDQFILLREVIKPNTAGNPFKKSTQFRNYVIVELMIAAGIRRGELLKLKLSHLPIGSKKTLTIVRSPDDKEDSRKNEPQVKTLEREIPLSRALAQDLWRYVDKHRKNGRHKYLFTSNRDGSPLCLGGVNWIFNVLFKKFFIKLDTRLYPHIMRHTFNDRIVRMANEKKWDDNKVAAMQKYINGWSENSKMPERYARRAIEEISMELMKEYQDELYR